MCRDSPASHTTRTIICAGGTKRDSYGCPNHFETKPVAPCDGAALVLADRTACLQDERLMWISGCARWVIAMPITERIRDGVGRKRAAPVGCRAARAGDVRPADVRAA